MKFRIVEHKFSEQAGSLFYAEKLTSSGLWMEVVNIEPTASIEAIRSSIDKVINPPKPKLPKVIIHEYP